MKRIAGERDEVGDFQKEYLYRITKCGFTQYPNALLRYGKKLGLKPADLVFILHILSYKIKGNESFPGMDKISAESGEARRTLFRSKAKLKKMGYLKTEKLYGCRSYLYRFDGLWKRVRELIDEEKERLYKAGKLDKEKYEDYKAMASMEGSNLAECQNGTN